MTRQLVLLLVLLPTLTQMFAADAPPPDYRALYDELLVKYNSLAKSYNADAAQLRNLQREYQIFRNQLAAPTTTLPFHEAVRTEILVRLYSARHFHLRSPCPTTEVYQRFRCVGTFAEFAAWVDLLFRDQQTNLATIWGIDDRDTLRAFFSLWIVASLWGPGGSDVYNQPGCIVEYAEVLSPGFKPENVTFERYQKSTLACCTDYSIFLKMLLDCAGIQNRVVYLKGHITNEAFLQNRWWSLDSMAGIVVDTSRREMNGGQTYPGAGIDRLDQGYLSVYWLQHPAMDFTTNVYRPVAGGFRVYYLFESLRGAFEIDRVLDGDEPFIYLPYGKMLKAFMPSPTGSARAAP